MFNTNYGNVGAEDLVPGTLRGYRAWTLDGRVSELRSISVNYGWYPGHNPPARCLQYSPQVLVKSAPEITTWEPSHSAPAPRCSCGYYATYKLEDLYIFNDWDVILNSSYVIGTVKAYGSVMLGTIGFRAQYMEIEALVDSSPLVAERAAAYGVPTVPSFEVLVSQYPPSNVDELIGAPRELLR